LIEKLKQPLEIVKTTPAPQGETPEIIKKLFDAGKINNVTDRIVATSLDDIAVFVLNHTQSTKGVKAAELRNLKLKHLTGKEHKEYKEYSERAYSKAVNHANT
jgi:hypothetical protein